MRAFLSILGISGILLCGVALAVEALPTGSFHGTGVWQAMDGSTGEYKSSVSIDAGSITIEAEYEREGEARNERHTMKLAPQGPGFYQLLDAKSQPIGQLACLDDQCSYSVKQDGLVVTETWRVSGNQLHKFGSKEFGDFKVVWKETLYSN